MFFASFGDTRAVSCGCEHSNRALVSNETQLMQLWRSTPQREQRPSASTGSARSSYFATFRHQLSSLAKTDALDEQQWLNMLGSFVNDWFRYVSHFVHCRDSLVYMSEERGLLSEAEAVHALRGRKAGVKLVP